MSNDQLMMNDEARSQRPHALLFRRSDFGISFVIAIRASFFL
jgi:hypothetical protein